MLTTPLIKRNGTLIEASWEEAIALASGGLKQIREQSGGDTGEIGNAIFEVPVFSVLIDTVRPEKPPYPDVILPGANFAESEGTYTNCERRIQHLYPAISPPAGKKN